VFVAVRIIFLTLVMAWLSPASFAAWFSSRLDRDDLVQLPDTYARIDNDATVVQLQAWVYERERRPGAITVFAKYLGIDEEALSLKEQAEFEARARLFFVDSQSNKRLRVQNNVYPAQPLALTDGFGVLRSKIFLPLPAADAGDWLSFSLSGSGKTFTGRAHIVPGQGVSIVSDIDDTIRDTQVLNRHEMLMNTFVRELKTIPGMSALYQQAVAVPGVRLHYVSNAPFALYPLLQRFLREQQFPAGSTHLRSVSLKSSVWSAMTHRQSQHKTETITTLLESFPARQFVLIGDTGEQDPEIYADLMRRFPDRIRKVLLHEVRPGVQGLDARLREVLRDIPVTKISVFRDATALALTDLALTP
jgi:phosphatidate phosphatase APP1